MAEPFKLPRLGPGATRGKPGDLQDLQREDVAMDENKDVPEVKPVGGRVERK